MDTTGSSSSAATPDPDRAAADVVVGLALPATSNGAAAVGRALGASLARRGPSLRWRIVVAHAGQPDGALAELREALGAGGEVVAVGYARHASDALDVPYHGQSGRARARYAILEAAHAQGARGCVLVDPRSAAQPGWLDTLLDPVAGEAADFVAPAYGRHPFAGALVHGIVAPAFRALYGARLRDPIGGDCACSHRLIEAVLPEPIWETDLGQLAIDLWLSATAVAGGFRVGQARLGVRLEEDRPGVDLSTIVSQVIGALFTDMERRVAVWQRVRSSRPVEEFGDPPPPAPAPDLDPAAHADSFRLAYRELHDVWAEVLPPLAILQWRRIAAAPLEGFRVDDALWARTIYDFAMGHRLRVIARDHLLRSLTPFYRAWLASFVVEMRQAPGDPWARLDRLGAAFEAEKPYLVSQWRWPERFKPVKMRRG
jgi:hypothetical protein